MVPTGTLELVVALVEGKARIYDAAGREQWVSGALVAGAYRRPFTFDTHEKASVVGVHLRAGYAGVVLGVPPGELTDRHVDLEAWTLTIDPDVSIRIDDHLAAAVSATIPVAGALSRVPALGLALMGGW